jgi:hypothetical protein
VPVVGLTQVELTKLGSVQIGPNHPDVCVGCVDMQNRIISGRGGVVLEVTVLRRKGFAKSVRGPLIASWRWSWQIAWAPTLSRMLIPQCLRYAGTALPVLEESCSRSGSACSGTVTLCHAVNGCGRKWESSVTAKKFLNVVADVWMN